MTLHLYELSPAIKQLLDLMEEEGKGGTDWTASLDELEGLFTDKAVGLAKLVNTWEAEVTAYENEMKRLGAHRTAAQNKIAWAKQYLKGNMQDAGIDHVKGDVVDIKLQNTAPGVIVEDESLVPMAYKSGTVSLPWSEIEKKELADVAEMSISKKGILDDFAESGIAVPGARVEKSQYVRIR